MKNLIKCVCMLGILVVAMSTNVYADYKGFDITAGFTWEQDPNYNAKNNNEYLMGIKWTESGAGTHKEWFRVVNSNSEQKAIGLLDYPSQNVVFLETTAKNGYYYYLQAHREHIINPRTQVRGTWQP